MPTPVPRRVLIASANPLFRDGLRRVYAARWKGKAVVAGTPSTMQETLAALESLQPDLVIIDHDDQDMNQAAFLNRFVTSDSAMQVVLVSLHSSELVVVYDRRRLSAVEAEAWLSDPWKDRKA